jgi:hypothetical protein
LLPFLTLQKGRRSAGRDPPVLIGFVLSHYVTVGSRTDSRLTFLQSPRKVSKSGSSIPIASINSFLNKFLLLKGLPQFDSSGLIRAGVVKPVVEDVVAAA